MVGIKHRQSSIQRKLSKLDLDTHAIKPSMPWRYNPDLDEDAQWEVFEVISPSSLFGMNAFLEKLWYFPGEREVPEEGAWIWVIRPPHASIETQLGGYYFAVPCIDAKETFGWKDKRFSVTAYTPDGEIRLYPHEYAKPKIEEMIEFWAEGAFEFHPFNEDLSDVELTERLFYVTSRGIPMADALPMVLGDILSPVGWFEMKTGGQLA